MLLIACSRNLTPTPVPTIKPPQLTAEQVEGLVADYLLREATQDDKALAFGLVLQAKAEYIGDGVWKVTTGVFAGYSVPPGDIYWFCFENTQKVVPGNERAQFVLYELKRQ